MGTTNLATAPAALQAGNYSALELRRMVTALFNEGVVGLGSDFAVSQRAAGANMSVDVAAGEAYVKGDSIAAQGLYYQRSAGTVNVPVTASDASNPRIDRVVLEIKDDIHDLGGLNVGRIRTIDGTPTAVATLNNLNGAGAVPSTCLLLANVLVPAASSSVTTANIRDARVRTTKSTRIANTATQSIANSTETVLTFDTDLHDYDEMHSTISNTSRIVIATTDVYKVDAALAWDANTAGDRIMRILVDGVVIVSDARRALATAGVSMGHTISAPVMPLNAGQYVECRVWQNSGGALNVGSHYMTAQRVR